MSKDSIPDFSTTASSNTDIGGLGLTDADNAKNLRGAFQQMMRILKRHDLGEIQVDDTWGMRNAADTTKTFSYDASNIPTGTARELDAEVLYKVGTVGSAPRETFYSTAGTFTHTFAASTRSFQIEAIGGGGGGGGVDGQGASAGAVACGGDSGEYGVTLILAKGSLLTGSVTVGAAGSAGVGASGGTGGTGGNSRWVDTTNTFTFGGGNGGAGAVATNTGAYGAPQAGNRFGGGGITNVQAGQIGYLSLNNIAMGGPGGGSPYGPGGVQLIIGATGASGTSGFNSGAGGSGASVYGSSTNNSGGAGRAGLLIVREW